MKYPQVVSIPSAVSDWLEEELEARGIDAVLYTRYILSLLHSHPVDVIYPDDLQFSCLNKEVRKYSGGRKRFRGSSSDWWRHALAEAERIKRSVAVECLMSASDQNYEIESLVDELCAKLKEVQRDPELPTSPQLLVEQNLNVSPQELAEKYYAAFPPLRSQQQQENPISLALMPKWRLDQSPIKKKGLKKPTKGNLEQKLQLKVDSETMKARTQNKQRFSYLTRNKNTTPRKSESFTGWDFNMFNNNNKKLKPTSENELTNDSSDQCVSDNWSNNDNEEMNMYDDLPVDIQLLLDSPDPQDGTVEMMNIVNMNNNGKRGYIPYGTSIMSSIWSTDQNVSYDNTFNAAVDSESSLDFKFSSISIDNRFSKSSNDWPTFENTENEVNSFFETNHAKRSLFLDGFRSLPGDWKKMEVEKETTEDDKMLKNLAESLMKLNHCKEKSCFAEIIPRSRSRNHNTTFNPFSRTTGMFNFNSRRSLSFDREKEDLLTSERSHFKPIVEKTDLVQKQYEDGSTFAISNKLEKVDYRRTESGSIWLETAFGQSKRYMEYKPEDADDDSSSELGFSLKFSVIQNDVACQTDQEPEFVETKTLKEIKDDPIDRDESSPPVILEKEKCTCPTNLLDTPSSPCPIHHNTNRPESILGELVWKYELKPCEKCNNNNTQWNSNWSTTVGTDWDSKNLRNIWNGGEVCESCLNLTKPTASPSPSIQNVQLLREDISQDGEQLLSDITNLQKSYMEELPLVAEISCDINELVSKERKRRHSFILDEQSSWSFASRLEEDCLIQMSTLPTLRSVTL